MYRDTYQKFFTTKYEINENEILLPLETFFQFISFSKIIYVRVSVFWLFIGGSCVQLCLLIAQVGSIM